MIPGAHSPLATSPLESVRQALMFLCTSPQGSAAQIHVRQISSVCSGLGLSTDSILQTLQDLELLKEVESLGNGFWLPAPTRAVSLDGEIVLLLSVASTEELKRHFPAVKSAGLGRIVEKNAVSQLPSQTLSAWAGLPSRANLDCTKVFLDAHSNTFSDVLLPESVEVFNVRTIKTKMPSGAQVAAPNWLPLNRQVGLIYGGVCLMRQAISDGRYSYFLGKFGRNRKWLSGPVIQDAWSFQYGLAALAGVPLTVLVRNIESKVEFTVPLAVPRPIWRLLRALCNRGAELTPRHWSCAEKPIWPVVEDALQAIGSEIINHV